MVSLLLAGFTAVIFMFVAILNRTWRASEHAQRQRLEQQRSISRLARRDVLTGLPNRFHLQRLLPRLISRVERDRSGLRCCTSTSITSRTSMIR